MLVYALKYTTVPPRQESLVILGPRGVVRLVKQLAEGYGPWLARPGLPDRHPRCADGEPFPLDADVNLETFPVPHTSESVALSLTAPEGRLVYTGDTGPRASWLAGPAGPTCCWRSARSPRRWPWDIHLTPEQAGELARDAKARQLVDASASRAAARPARGTRFPALAPRDPATECHTSALASRASSPACSG